MIMKGSNDPMINHLWQFNTKFIVKRNNMFEINALLL